MKNKKTTPTPLFTKPMPQAEDAEKAVISTMITYGKGVMNDLTFLTPDMFYTPEHCIIFEAMLSLRKKNIPVDIITVTDEIRAMDKIEQVPPVIITSISSYVLTSAYIQTHALIVLQKYVQRRIIELSMLIQAKAFDDGNDVGDVLFEAGRDFEKLEELMIGKQQISSYEDISHMFYEDINLRISRYGSNEQTGVNTGLTELNRLTSGWQPAELIILAGRPSMGKTAMALHFAHSASLQNIPVVFFSLEMSKVALYKRSILSQCDEIDAADLKSGNLINSLGHIDKSVTNICKLPFYVDDNVSVNMAYIRANCRLLHKKKKCGMVIIDYLQLITPEKNKYSNREQDIAVMSREAKLIAKELNIPVILLSQLNRDVEKRQNKRPILSDLRESGAIEQDADMVVFLHRPEYYKLSIKDKQGNPVERAGELIIAKYRNGPTGTVVFRHNKTLTKIENF